MSARFVILGILALAVCAGCGTPAECEEGATDPCSCQDGSNGTRTCGAEGEFGACDCGDPASGESNACGGDLDLRLDGEVALPGDGCGECDDGVVACDGPNALACALAGEPNECGGCEPLAARIGEPCDGCGGTWACGDDGDLLCDGGADANACGGCADLGGDPLFTCDVGGTTGVLYCRAPDQLVCVIAGDNACGGEAGLDGLPTSNCGTCGKGKWTCESESAVVCEGAAAGVNECGGCAALPHSVGDPCDCGEWECRGPNAMRCGGFNTCARCGDLDGEPGTSCGDGQIWACAADGVECVSDDRNACGGTESLDQQPGEVCGGCGDGIVLCVGRNVTACAGASQGNACGGCAPLPGRSGEPCGYGQVWTCDGTDDLECVIDTSAEVCGGDDALTELPGSQCGECGVRACQLDGSLACVGEVDTDRDEGNCGDCGESCDPGQACVVGGCVSDRPVAVETGDEHSCALYASGRVACWGENGAGQLGDGTIAPADAPVDVIAMPPARALTVGAYHSCAISDGGALHCWGRDNNGQLGPDGSSSDGPTLIDLGAPVAHASAGFRHTCAATRGGELYCWGLNTSGQLGNGMTGGAFSGVPEPQHVDALSDVTVVSAGFNSTCAATSTGQTQCWGANSAGQLGIGVSGDEEPLPASTLPVAAVGLASTKYGEGLRPPHRCALSASSLHCWGANGFMQVGDFEDTTYPREISLSDVTDVAAGTTHTCAVADADVYCWGARRTAVDNHGELGNGSTAWEEASAAPAEVTSGLGAVDIVDVGAGSRHTCAVTATGDVYCWGRNNAGQALPGASPGDEPIPLMVQGL